MNDETAIFDSDFNQLFEDARAMRVTVHPSKRVTDQPVESGGVKSDWAIIMPIELELSVIVIGVDYASTYSTIQQLFANNDLVMIGTRVDLYSDMMLVEMPHEETPDKFDVVEIALRFREFIMFDAQFQSLTASDTSSTNTSTVNKGEQQPQSSVAYDLFTKYK